MATAAPDGSLARLWPGALLWVAAGGWALMRLPPDGAAGLWLGVMWAGLLVLRWLPGSPLGWTLPRIAGLCCPTPRPRSSDVAMGWMMGTLWWHAEGCLGSSVPPAAGVALHLIGMGVLTQAARRLEPRVQGALALLAWAGLALLLLWVQDPAPILWLCMLLLTLAWACEPAGTLPGSLAVQRTLMLVAGPLGLGFIHLRWPLMGPDALLQPLLWLALAAIVCRVLSAPGQAVRVLNSGGSA